jgi:hypothetical protein
MRAERLEFTVKFQIMYRVISMLSATSAVGYIDDMDTVAKDAVNCTGTAGVEGVDVPCGRVENVDCARYEVSDDDDGDGNDDDDDDVDDDDDDEEGKGE